MAKHRGPGILFVTGMHRSGTSAIASQAVRAGGFVPEDLVPAASDNPAGFFESQSVVRTNEKVLELFGSNWRDPSPLPEDWLDQVKTTDYFTEATEFLTEQSCASQTLILKDPRFSRLLPLWLAACEQLEIRPATLVVIRNPVSVARSLWVRNNIPSTHSLQLWCRYYIDLNRWLDQVNHRVIEFDSFLESPERLRDNLAHFDLPGLAWAEGDSIIEAALVHHRSVVLHNGYEQDLQTDFESRQPGCLMQAALLRFHYAVLGGDLMALERRHYGTVAMILDKLIAEREDSD